jgi:hypothetical protein
MKKLLSILAFGLFLINASAQQIDGQTGNIVYSTVNPAPPPVQGAYTWNGFIVSNTNGGGLSGGNTPAYNPDTGTFIFGYTQRTVSYGVAISAINFALANNGSNVQINGFKYSWEYYNQDFSRGTLTGNISLTNSSGQTVQSFGYNMPQTTNGWTLMSGTQNFNTQYPAYSLGGLGVAFTGRDDRFWAGYYGPQIRGIDVKMLYSVPVPNFSTWSPLTNENGTFTLNSPGIVRYGAQGTYIYKSYEAGTYECSNNAWGQDPLGGVYKSCSLGTNTSPPPSSPLPTTTTVSNTTTTTINEITTAAAQPTVTTSPTTSDVSTTNTGTSSSTLSAPTPTPTTTTTATTSQTTSSTNNTSNPTTTSTVATVATTTPSSGGSRTVDGTGIGLSVIARNATREQAIAMQAVQNAVAIAEQAGQQAQQEAVSVAQSSSATSNVSSLNPVARVNLTTQRSEQVAVQSQTTQTTTSLASFAQPGQQTNVVRTIDPNKIGSTTTTLSETNIVQSVAIQEQVTTNQSQTSFALLTPQQTNTTTNQLIISEMQKSLIDRTNPINEIIEGRSLELPTTSTVQQKTTVNTSVSDNEIAGGVSINRMATTPVGYNQYLNIAIADAAFYAPKEIYKGQKNVDNVRALRQMSSDRLHQDMVNQQYRRN